MIQISLGWKWKSQNLIYKTVAVGVVEKVKVKDFYLRTSIASCILLEFNLSGSMAMEMSHF